MPQPFLIDTNGYFILFQYPKPLFYTKFVEKLTTDNIISFYISEITSMEIHSVLGKYGRGCSPQCQLCEREIMAQPGNEKCQSMWVIHGRKKMKPRLFREIRKCIADVEARRGNIKATIIDLNQQSIETARILLFKYADKYSFGSHDALIAGTIMTARKSMAIDLTLVTSDKGLKSVLREELVPFYDPRLG
jgi:hypothetical protein